MTTLTINKISFATHICFFVLSFLSLGIFIGTITLILSLLGSDIYVDIGTKTFTGIEAGVISMFISPFIFLISGFIFSLLSYIPTCLILKSGNGINIKVKEV